MHRAVAELGDLQVGLAQLDQHAVLEPDVDRCVVDPHLAFRRDAGHGHVLQLPAVDRLGHHADLFDELGVGWLLCIRRMDGQAHQHRHGIGRVRQWRVATAILDMAVLAGVGIEQRAQAIARRGGGRRNHPRVAKETVADAEVQAPRGRQVGRGQGKGVLVALVYRRRATGPRFTRLCFREARGVIASSQA